MISSRLTPFILNLLVAFAAARNDLSDKEYLGKFKFVQHQVQGHAYALDDRTILVHRFYYDGEGPPGVKFTVLPLGEKNYEKGLPVNRVKESRNAEIKATYNTNYTLTLPFRMKISEVERLVLWCEEYGVSFGRIDLLAGRDDPSSLERPNLDLVEVGPLGDTEHKVAGTVFIDDKEFLIIRDFNYDGQGPSVVFYAGEDETLATGYILQYPYKPYRSLLGTTKVKRHVKKDIRIRLPPQLNAYKLRWFSVWCNTFEVSFGHVSFDQ